MIHTRKNGLADRRYASSRPVIQRSRVLYWQQLLGCALLGFIAGVILTKSLYDATHRPLLNPLVSPPKPLGMKVEKVEAKETPCDQDPITYIRCSGEKLGKPNATIMQMIRIARYESNFNPRAKNKSSSASGLFQIIAGTWYSNDCVGDKYNFVDNTNCAWKIQSKRGFTPWEVYNNGKAK